MTCNKVIYDRYLDRRENLYTLEGENTEIIKQQALSVACFVSKQNLIQDPGTKKYNIAPTVPTLRTWIHCVYKAPLGEKEPFAQELTIGNATGFLVTENTLMTAAHVVCKKGSDEIDGAKLENYYVLFDCLMEDADHCKTEYEEHQVFTVRKVIFKKFSKFFGWKDWAFLKLDRKVPGREPLKLDYTPLQKDVELYMLGYPSGLPLKKTGNAAIMNNDHENYFECKVDACGGNSGSPVFRLDTHEVVGILCQGNTDYIIDHNYDEKGLTRCVSNRMYTADVRTYEKCQRISTLTHVKDYVERWSIGFKLQTIPLPIDVKEPGFYVCGQCTTTTCTFAAQSIWMAYGRGTFYLEDILHRSNCVECKTGSLKVENLGIYDSAYKIEGELSAPKKTPFQTENVAKQKLKTFKQEGNFEWSYLKIEVIH